MRIIGGEFKGRVIDMPKDIRPTSNKARGAFFEILKNHIAGSRFLDLYSGSGAMGLEALSRGAKSVSFVDNSPDSIKILRSNTAKLSILDESRVYINKIDAFRFLSDSKAKKQVFDIVYLDPPYHKDMARNTLIALSDCDILTRNAIIAAETYKKEELPEEIGTLKKIRTSKYGDTVLEFYKNDYTD